MSKELPKASLRNRLSHPVSTEDEPQNSTPPSFAGHEKPVSRRFLSPQLAAAQACVCINLIYQACAAGTIAHLRLGGTGKRGKILIEQEDLEAWLCSKKVGRVQESRPHPPKRKSVMPTLRHLKL